MEKSIKKAVCAKKIKGINDFLILCSFLYFINISTERRLKDCFSLTLWSLTTHPDFKPIDLYPCGLKRGINFALEPEWAYIWVGLYSRFYCKLRTSK